MSDYSLMNPDHLNKEIVDLEDVISRSEEFANEVHDDIERMYSYVRDTFNRQEDTTLTTEHVRDLIQTLSKIDVNRYRYSSAEKFALRVYNHLKQDRRWLIASKLRFLKK